MPPASSPMERCLADAFNLSPSKPDALPALDSPPHHQGVIHGSLISAPSSPESSSQGASHLLSVNPFVPSALPKPTSWLPRNTSPEGTLSLHFTNAPASATNPKANENNSAPPAFFPLTRVSFCPKLVITSPSGLKLATEQRDGVTGMMLGVTGVVETLQTVNGISAVKSSRMIADFATDLSNGVRIWRRDSARVLKQQAIKLLHKQGMYIDGEDVDYDADALAQGMFILPLSMKIPCSEKLPPSFESQHYRIRYTMSLALFSSLKQENGLPSIILMASVPFHILPSTLPAPCPPLPRLAHDCRSRSLISSFARALSPIHEDEDQSSTHVLTPSLPTTHYSPGTIIPISLRIIDCPPEPTDLYIRLSLVRKVFIRESEQPFINEWGLPEEQAMSEHCKETETVLSRWGYIPYASRMQQGAVPGDKAEVLIQDIALPLGNASLGTWSHGYSSSLDIRPCEPPSMKHGECSWFSRALSERPPVASEYAQHIHASTRFFISVEVGFAHTELSPTMYQISQTIPTLPIPRPNSFSPARRPTYCPFTNQDLTNPFPISDSLFRIAPLPTFPGKLRTLLIPITIGSVAEPQLSCLSTRSTNRPGSLPVVGTPPSPTTPEDPGTRAARDADESTTDRYERIGDDGEEAWILPPPDYKTALATVPAYVACL